MLQRFICISLLLSLFSCNQSFAGLRSLLRRNVTVFAAAYSQTFDSQRVAKELFYDKMSEQPSSPLRRIESREAFTSEASGMHEHPENSMSLSCMTYNMCNNPNDPAFRKDASGKLFEKYRWSARIERMAQLIKDEQPDIIGLQEIRDDREVHALIELWKHLGPQGYEIIHFRNNASPGSLSNVIAYNPQRVTLDRVSRYWSSETPDQNSDSWGNGWGRVNFVATFYPSTVNEIRGQKINGPDYTFPPVHYINVHNGLGHPEKMGSNRVHVAQAQQLIADKQGIVIVGGDFNNFDEPGRGGKEEMAIFEEAGFVDLAKPLKTANGVAVSGTFPGYEYDPYKAPKGTFGTQLDHMQCKVNLPRHLVAYWSYVNAGRYNGTKTTAVIPQSEAELLQTDKSDDDRDFPSDHLPVVTTILMTPKPQAPPCMSKDDYNHYLGFDIPEIKFLPLK